MRPTAAPHPIVSFALSRGVAWLAATAAFLAVRPSTAGNRFHGPGLSDVGWPVDVWANWDGGWYTSIAEHGYRRQASSAFFPLYPYLARGLGWLIGGHVVLASVLLSLAACLLAFLALHRLTSDLAGPDVANRAVLYLTIFPTALFFQAAYAESLFLLFALTTFLLAERGRLLSAGATCGLAMLTRPAGTALLLALIVFACRRDAWKRGLGAVGLAVFLFCLYPLVLWLEKGDPLSFAAAQQHWGRQFSPAGPLIAAFESVGMTILYVVRFFAPARPTREALDFQHAAFNNVLALLALVAFIALLVAVYRRFGGRSPYFVYAAASLALPLFSPISGNPLLSLPRLGLVIFPFFMALALSVDPERTIAHRVYVASSTALLAVASAAFALYGWVS